MTDEYYTEERERLEEVLADAVRRGDYYLELDVKEQLVKLMDRYYTPE